MKAQLIIGGVSFGIGFFLAWVLLGKNTRESDFTWKFGESELKINVKQDLVGSEVLLKKIFDTPFAKAGTIAWLKSTQGLFPSTDPELADQIGKLTVDTPLAKRLLELSQERKGPWKQVAKEVSIGIPEGRNQPREEQANVCGNGPFRGAKLVLEDPTRSRIITVQAAGVYDCIEGLTFPDIQLNATDGQKLFGDSRFSKYQKALAAILR